MLAQSSWPRSGAASSRRRKSLQHELQGFRSPKPRLYRQFFTREECDWLDRSPPDSALSEIYLMRALLMRMLATSKRKTRLTLKDRSSILAAICQAALTMAALARLEFKQQIPSLLDCIDDLDPHDLRATDEVPP